MPQPVIRAAVLLLSATPAAATEDAGVRCRAHMAAIDRAAAATMQQGSPGMVIAIGRHGRTPVIRSYGTADLESGTPMQPGSVLRIASVTKQFTAAAVLRLEEDGVLSVDDPLARHLPEFSHLAGVTLRHLMYQTSGIPDFAEDREGQKRRALAHSTAEMLTWIGRLAPVLRFAPGSRWEYSNSNYVLLGAVIERATGKSLASVFKEALFDRAALRDTAFDAEADVVPLRVRGYRKARTRLGGFVNADPISHSVPGAAGGLRSTAADLLRWTEALFDGRIISARTLRNMVRPGTMGDGRTTRFGMPAAWQTGLNADYAMGVFVSNTPLGDRVWHSGDIDGFAAWLAHYPRQRVTIALLQNSQSADFDTPAIESAAFAAVREDCL